MKVHYVVEFETKLNVEIDHINLPWPYVFIYLC